MASRAAVLLAGLVLLVASCGGGGDDRQSLLVMAAASLTDAFAEIEAVFEAEHPDVDVQLNLAGSASLREQILQGAPADLFAAANEETMQVVIDAGLARTPQVFATNELVLAVPDGNPGAVQELADLADEGLLVGLCAAGVPCGDFARLALGQAGVVASLDTNEGDVRALVTKIAADELDAGIVYATDVEANPDVTAIALPSSVEVAIRYPVATLTESDNPQASDQFIAFVTGEAGQAILASYGFGTP